MSQKWPRGYGGQEELRVFQKEPGSPQVGGEDPVASHRDNHEPQALKTS